MDSTQKFEMQKKKIEENIEYIRRNLGKTKGPIFIELIGTPKSGKTTLVKHMQSLFTKNQIGVEKRQETAEYNPIENKDLEEYNIWMIMELMKNMSEDLSNDDPRIIIYDRGILDRLPWIGYSQEDGTITEKDATLLRGLYGTDFVEKYRPLAYGFFTTPELSVKRKGKEGRLVNLKNVDKFNRHFMANQSVFGKMSKRYRFLETDSYQGKLNDFILDVAERVTSDTRSIIEERIPATEEKDVDLSK